MTDTTSELRQKLQEAHNRFHGRFTTHAEVAKHSRWTAQELENVQIEDEELYYDELLALLAAQRQRWEAAAREDELKAFDMEITQHEKRLGLYDLDSVVLDNLVVSGVATEEQRQKRDNKVTERRACLVMHHITKSRIAALDGERGKEQADV